MNSAIVCGVNFVRSKYLNEQDLTPFIAEVINGFFPVAVCKKVRNYYRKTVLGAGVGAVGYAGLYIRLAVKLQIFKVANRSEKRILADNCPVRIFQNGCPS